MSGTPTGKLLSRDEYEASEATSTTRHEYVHGRAYPLPKESVAHSRLTLQLARLLDRGLTGSPCTPAGTDTRIRIASFDVDLYPDAAIIGPGAPPPSAGKPVVENARIVFEVLSPETEYLDRTEKFDFYQGLPKLVYYVLIAQDRMRVEQYRRTPEGWLLKTLLTPEAELQFAEIKWSCTLAEIYQGVEVPSGLFISREKLEKPTGNLSLFESEPEPIETNSVRVETKPAPAAKPATPARKGVVIFCDGACSGNPGPGGWGAIVETDGERVELSGGSAKTTNNQMELTALIEALDTVPAGTPVHVVTDSEYLIKGATQWMKGWMKNGWKTASKQPVKNKELWQELNDLLQQHPVKFEWVKGHAGHEENERCDELARAQAEKNR